MPSQSARHIASAVIAMLAMAMVAIAGYLGLSQAHIRLPPPADCRLERGPCQMDFPGGGRILAAVLPLPVPTTQPLRIVVELQGVTARRVEAEFVGVHMNMGMTRLSLAAVDGQRRYAGSTTLPLCVTASMVWEMTVLVDDGRRVLAAPFLFETHRQGD